MTFDEFQKICMQESVPEDLNNTLLALWFDYRGDWDTAHRIVQDTPGINSAWVHAYLHRKEGDQANASYWYSRAGRPKPSTNLENEWEQISAFLLDSLPE